MYWDGFNAISAKLRRNIYCMGEPMCLPMQGRNHKSKIENACLDRASVWN